MSSQRALDSLTSKDWKQNQGGPQVLPPSSDKQALQIWTTGNVPGLPSARHSSPDPQDMVVFVLFAALPSQRPTLFLNQCRKPSKFGNDFIGATAEACLHQ